MHCDALLSVMFQCTVMHSCQCSSALEPGQLMHLPNAKCPLLAVLYFATLFLQTSSFAPILPILHRLSLS